MELTWGGGSEVPAVEASRRAIRTFAAASARGRSETARSGRATGARCCTPPRSAQSGNGMNAERRKKDAPTSAVLREALLNTPMSVKLEREATRSTQRSPRPASTLYTSGRSSTAHGSERAGRGHGVVAVED